MDFIDLIIQLAQESKYPLLFLIYLIEGPIAGFVSAFIASTGILNIYIVFVLLLIAEYAADIFYFLLGRRISDTEFNKRLSKYEQKGFLKILKDSFAKTPALALAFVKAVGVIAVLSIILMGKYNSMSFKKFSIFSLIFCIIKDTLIVTMGYGLGISLGDFLAGYNIYKIVVWILTVLLVLFVLFKANESKIERKIFTLLSKLK